MTCALKVNTGQPPGKPMIQTFQEAKIVSSCASLAESEHDMSEYQIPVTLALSLMMLLGRNDSCSETLELWTQTWEKNLVPSAVSRWREACLAL